MKVNKKEVEHVLDILRSRFPQCKYWEFELTSRGTYRIVDNKNGQFYPLGKYLRNAGQMFEVLDSVIDLMQYMKDKENGEN